jgi:hypothetical protein
LVRQCVTMCSRRMGNGEQRCPWRTAVVKTGDTRRQPYQKQETTVRGQTCGRGVPFMGAHTRGQNEALERDWRMGAQRAPRQAPLARVHCRRGKRRLGERDGSLERCLGGAVVCPHASCPSEGWSGCRCSGGHAATGCAKCQQGRRSTRARWNGSAPGRRAHDKR